MELALPLHEETLKLRKAKLGPDHPDTLASMNNLAAAYDLPGSWTWPCRFSRKRSSSGRRNSGLIIPTRSRACTTWPWLIGLPGSWTSPCRFSRKHSGFGRRTGSDHPHTLVTMNELAVAYRSAGKLDLALPLFGETLKLRNAKLGPDHPDSAGTMASLGTLLVEKRLFTEAEPLLRQCLAIREKTNPDVWTTFNTRRLLGLALLGQKKYTEAEPLLLKAYEGMKDREKSIPKSGGGQKRIPEAINALIELYTATNKPKEVEKWQAERAKYPEVKPAGAVK